MERNLPEQRKKKPSRAILIPWGPRVKLRNQEWLPLTQVSVEERGYPAKHTWAHVPSTVLQVDFRGQHLLIDTVLSHQLRVNYSVQFIYNSMTNLQRTDAEHNKLTWIHLCRQGRGARRLDAHGSDSICLFSGSWKECQIMSCRSGVASDGISSHKSIHYMSTSHCV